MQILKGKEQTIRDLTEFIQNSMVSESLRASTECYRQFPRTSHHVLPLASHSHSRTCTYLVISPHLSFIDAHKHFVTTSCGREGRTLWQCSSALGSK